ncbi:hypothetical protein THF1C08_1380002 [Vibrio jasicida]|uniref:Uncharacterized protein n=1 Tax=Vibrio jasicida TaxID=766224 RepID=A0AAU9QHQ6_9VIBR|nr:hypothetical protein THF1C08_1380002 [Vibrio jasicida]CAH1577439.1 hypothetical protein THF1A12_1420002 [Vibrio jasicida]
MGVLRQNPKDKKFIYTQGVNVKQDPAWLHNPWLIYTPTLSVPSSLSVFICW